jgi:aspartate carbamoyltransferase regulatory subunit
MSIYERADLTAQMSIIKPEQIVNTTKNNTITEKQNTKQKQYGSTKYWDQNPKP